MMPLLITIAILLVAVSALLVFPWKTGKTADRAALNRAFYQARLRELEQDNAPEQAKEREQMVAELQHTLLNDIPVEAQTDTGKASGTYGPLILAIVALAVVSTGVYLKTSGFLQVQAWKRVTRETPRLLQRVMDPAARPLGVEDLSRLGLGLRTRLQDDPDNVQAWQMLGRIGMVLNNADTATQAFARAWALAPQNRAVVQDYAEALTRSGDPADNQRGGEMLRELLRADHTDTRTLGLLAFNAFEQQRYQEAIGAWQILLRLLPENDDRRMIIERSIAQAKVDAGMDSVKLTVTITLAPETLRALPERGAVFVSLMDGDSPVPVAVKKLPLGHFPLTVSLDDANAMMPGKTLLSVRRGRIKVRVSRSEDAAPKPGDWLGESEIIKLPAQRPVVVKVSQRQP